MTTTAELRAQLIALQAENDKLKASKASGGGTVTPKVSVKGCLGVYGLGQRPCTLYAGQWLRLLDNLGEQGIRQYIADNSDALAWKGDTPVTSAIMGSKAS